MKDFDNIMKAKVEYVPYEGYWFSTEDGENVHDYDWENEVVVRYSDYKDLLEKHKELQYRMESLEK